VYSHLNSHPDPELGDQDGIIFFDLITTSIRVETNA